MSQNFNYNGPPHDSHGSHGPHGAVDPIIEGLSTSLIYPGRSTPAQQNYSRAWPGAQNWQTQRQESYNYGMPYQAQGLDTGNYFSSHQQQEFVPFEDGEALYQNENGNTHLGLAQNMQASNQNSMTSGINMPQDQLHTRLHDLLKHQSQPRPSKFEEQERASNATGDGISQKPDVSALNDRAAELRARLLAANRSSTPGTPSNQASKSSDPTKTKTNEANSSQKQMNDSNSTEASAAKSAGHTTTQSLGGTKIIDKSPNKAQTLSSERANATTDIDGLFAEARAAVAAEKPKTGEKSGQDGSTATKLKGNVNDSLSKGTSSEKGQHGTKAGVHRHSLNKSTSSSETSELGEIRSDSGKTSSAVQLSEPVNGKLVKEGSRPVDEKSKHQTHASNGLEKQPTMRVDGDSQNRQTHPTSSTKPSASSPTTSQLRDQSQSSRTDYRRDRYDRPMLTQEPRKELEQDRRRDLDLKERNTDSRRSSGFRTYGHESERGRSDYQVDMEPRRPQNVRYDVEESARAAAEYKKELEDRRRQASRPTFDRAESSRDQYKKEVDAVGPRTPKARVIEVSQHGTNNNSSNRHINTRSGEIWTKSSSGEAQDQNIGEDDVRDWLEMTGFADPAYRKNALARFRKIRALDIQRAELEREAQLEIEGRSYIARAPSALPRESVEASGSHTNISPKIIRTSIQSMPPPPLPSKDVADDIGIKIKDSANREGPSNLRTVEDDPRSSRKTYEQYKTKTSNLKRPHVDDEPDARNGRPAEKLTRLDTRGSSDFKVDSSPNASSGQWSLETRITRNEGTFERVKSRSPDSRHRSVSPIRARTSNYDKYVLPRSRGSPVRRNGYSPDRLVNIEKTKSLENLWCWNCQQSGHLPKECTIVRKRRDLDAKESSSYEDSHSSPYVNYIKKGEVKTENEQDGQFWGDYQTSTMRPYGQYQQYQSSNYRGRGRGGRGGYAFANNRGGYRPYRPVDGAQDAQFSGSSASLNLRAGGKYIGWEPSVLGVALTQLVYYSRLEIFYDQKLEFGKCGDCSARRELLKYSVPITKFLILIPYS